MNDKELLNINNTKYLINDNIVNYYLSLNILNPVKAWQSEAAKKPGY